MDTPVRHSVEDLCTPRGMNVKEPGFSRECRCRSAKRLRAGGWQPNLLCPPPCMFVLVPVCACVLGSYICIFIGLLLVN